MCIKNVIAVLALFVTCWQPAFAQQTIFNVPSADVTEEGTVYLEHETQTRPYAPGAYWQGTHYFAYGIGHQTELDATLYNLTSPPSDNTSLGLGFKSVFPLLQQSMAGHEMKYTVGSQLLPSFDGRGLGNWTYSHLSGRLPQIKTRLTAGVSGGTRQLFGRNTIHFIAGIEQPVTERLVLIADWYSGTQGLGLFTSGFSYKFPKSAATVFLGYHIPNNKNVLSKPGITFELAKFFK